VNYVIMPLNGTHTYTSNPLHTAPNSKKNLSKRRESKRDFLSSSRFRPAC
jgi:hypothetical protein